jgi:hypothetical protein
MKPILKMKNHILILLFFTLLISSCGIIRNKMTNETYIPLLNSPKELSFSPITWHNDSIGNELVEKTSFYVPVIIKGIDQQVFMQFDLGANISMLYGNTFLAFIEKNADLKNDTINKENHIIFKNAEIQISDSISLKANKLYVKKDFGYDYIDSSFTIIGTLGYDIIGDNVLILDFKNNQYALSKDIPLNMKAEIQYIEKADLDKFPIILPFKLGKKKIKLLYDTGTSRFPILTELTLKFPYFTRVRLIIITFSSNRNKIY